MYSELASSEVSGKVLNEILIWPKHHFASNGKFLGCLVSNGSESCSQAAELSEVCPGTLPSYKRVATGSFHPPPPVFQHLTNTLDGYSMPGSMLAHGNTMPKTCIFLAFQSLQLSKLSYKGGNTGCHGKTKARFGEQGRLPRESDIQAKNWKIKRNR